LDLAASAVPDVLLVDDDERLLMLLADYLRAAGLQVETASSGTEALQQFERYLGAYHRAPQVVVTDARMPDLVGTELARRLKERAPLTRVVLLSAYVNTGVQTDSPYLDAVLAKPCDLSVLLREVAGLADFPLN
jgi:CheY-like chemotaxis protein